MYMILLLQEFDFEIIDKKGSENVVADHLSRIDPSVLEKVEFDSLFSYDHLFTIFFVVIILRMLYLKIT